MARGRDGPLTSSPSPGRTPEARSERSLAPGMAAALGAAALAAAVLRHLADGGRTETSGLVALFWAASVLAGTLAVRLLEARRGSDPGPRAGRALYALLGFVLLAALAARLVRLGDVPWVLDGDAALFASQALDLHRDGVRNPFGYSTHAYPVPSLAVGGAGMLALGPTIAGARLAWALVGVAGVLAAWLLFRRLLGPRAALAATALLALWHFPVHYARIGLNNIGDPLLLSLLLLFLVRALRSASARDWWGAGAVAGLSLAGYAGAFMAAPLLGGLAALAAARSPHAFFARHGARPLAAAAAFLLVAAPMLQSIARDPANFVVRQRTVGLLAPGRLAEMAAQRGVSPARVVLEQASAAGLAFHATRDRSPFYALTSPLLDRVTGAFFLLGLLHATARSLRRRGVSRLFPLVAWWWCGMLFGGVLTETPPQSQRLVGLAVPTAALAVSGAALLLRPARRLFRLRPAVPLALGVAAFAAVSFRTYAEFTPLRRYGGANAELATAVGLRLAPLRGTHAIHLAAPPRLYVTIPPLRFLLRDGLLLDVAAPLGAPPPAACAPEGAGVVFAFTPERRDELAWVRCTFPDGELEDLRRPVDGALVATLWIVSPEAASAARVREAAAGDGAVSAARRPGPDRG